MKSKGLQILFAAFLFSVGHGAGIQERIYGGKNAKPGQFPYQALISKDYKDVNVTFCSGALIKPNYVLTAATCLLRGPPFRVYLGVADLLQLTTDDEIIVVDKSSIIPHEKYNPKTHVNDIGLLKLPINAKMSDTVKTIDVPPLSWTKIKNNNVDKFDDADGYVTGYGKTDQNDFDIPISMHMEYTDLSIIPHSICKQMTNFHQMNETDGILCVSTPMKGPCSEDEGAPMRLVNTTDSKYVIGIFSWNTGRNCGDYSPAIFTYVGYYIKWIQSRIGS